MTGVARPMVPAVPAVLLLVGLGWATGARGGSRPVDLVVLSVLSLLALAATMRRARREGGLRGVGRYPVVPAVLALALWAAVVTVGAGTGAGGAGWGFVWLLLLLLVTWAAADRLDADERLVLVGGVVVVGAVLAASAVTGWSVQALAGGGLATRAPTLLGYENAAGALMVASTGGALHLHRERRLAGPLSGAVCGLLGLGVLATGSRLALLVGLAGLAWWVWRRRTARVTIAGAVVAAPAVLVLVHRFATSPDERLLLWASAWHGMASNPVTGRGPAPVVLAGATGARPTTHAHNELLHVGLEYGVPGLVLACACLVAVAAGLVRRTAIDPALVVGCSALALLGLTDFALRFPAVSVALVVLAAATWPPAGRAGTHPPVGPSATGGDRAGTRGVDPAGAAAV